MIDGVSNRVIATVAIGLWPQQVAINARTNRASVVNTHADSVSVIDGADAHGRAAMIGG